MTREYLTLAAEILSDAVDSGHLGQDDYCFDVVAKGFRRLDNRELADKLRQEDDARLARATLNGGSVALFPTASTLELVA